MKHISVVISGAVARTSAFVLLACLLAGCGRFSTPEELLVDARTLIERKDLGAAVIQLKNALQKNPDFGPARLELGKIYVQQGDMQSAAKELKRASELGQPVDEVAPALARALVSTGEAKAVIERFSGTKLSTPAAEGALKAALGDAMLETGNAEGARKAYDEALGLDGRNPDAVVGKARALISDKDLDGAQSLLAKLLESGSATPDAWFLDAQMKALKGQLDQSIASYRKAYQLKPDFVRARFIVISMYAQQNRLDDARKELADLRKAVPKAPEASYLEGLILVKENKWSQARDQVNKVLSVAPEFIPALELAALTEFELKSYATAEKHAEKMIAKGSDSILARKIHIRSLLKTGRVAKARQEIDSLLKSKPGNPEIESLAGEVYLAAGDTAAAEKVFGDAARLHPDDAAMQSRLGLSRLASGNYAGGIKALESAANSDDDIKANMLLVLAHMRAKKFDEALAAIQVLEKKKPDDPATQNLRGTVLLGKNDTAGARAAFEKALQLAPGFFPAVSNLARLDLRDNKVADAEKRFSDVLAKSPDHPDALMALAGLKAQRSEGRADAEVLLKKAIEAHPKLSAPRSALVQLYLLGGDNAKALGAAKQMVDAFPDDVAALDQLASMQEITGDLVGAVSTRTKMAELAPTDPAPLVRLASLQAMTKHDPDAIESLRKALALKPELIEAQAALVSVYNRQHATEEALKIVKQVQKQRPASAVGYLMEADVLMEAGKEDRAIQALREAFSVERSGQVLIRVLAKLQKTGNGAAEAKKLSDAWLKENPKDGIVRLYLGDLALSQKRYDEARTRFEGLLELAPGNPVVLNNLAWLAAQRNDPQALKLAEQAYAAAPNNAAVLDTYGVILVDSGQGEKGIKLQQQAVAAAPLAVDLRLNLAKSLVKAGRKPEARKELEALSTLGQKYPRSAEVAEMLKTL